MKLFQNIILLAAGKATRFFPLADKNLFVFSGAPLIRHQLEKLLPYGEKLFIVGNQDNHRQLTAIVNHYPQAVVVQQKGEGQASGLLSLNEKVKSEALVLNNCDLFNLTPVFSRLTEIKQKYQLILTAKKMKDYFPGGYFQFKNDKIAALVEKPAPEERPSSFVRLVVDYFSDFAGFQKKLMSLPDPHKDGAYESALNHYLATVTASHIVYDGDWYFLKYPWHVLSVKDYFLSHLKSFQGRNVKIHPTAIIEGTVHLEDNVVVHEYAKITGPCYIGKNSLVGNYALIRESMIGEQSVVGGYSEVARSYLGKNIWLHRNYVGDSVLENDILCGAGAVCANLRFDGQEILGSGLKKLGALIGSGAKIGVNVSLMPGVKIAPRARAAPNAMVGRDIGSYE